MTDNALSDKDGDAIMAEDVSADYDETTLAEFDFVPQTKHTTFKNADVGFGPYIVPRESLLDEIINEAGPSRSVHISGCKGAGKTTVLHQLGLRLKARGEKRVFFFDSASLMSVDSCLFAIRGLARSKLDAYLLVDETQDNPTAAVFTTLLKNNTGHNITTIGAGVPKWQSVSGNFKKTITTDRLFLSEDMLASEGVINYFSQGATEAQKPDITAVLRHIRSYAGGHIYPLMWLSERLVSMIVREGATAEAAIMHLSSIDLRRNEEYREMCWRIVPHLDAQTFRSGLLTLNPDRESLLTLQKYGLIDERNTVISQLLFDEYVKSLTGSLIFEEPLAQGIDGVRQLLVLGLSNLQWDQYNANGGPIEDALSFELLFALSSVSNLDTRLFNPKLVNYNAGRKPDLYFNATVDSYVECILTTANSPTERKKLDEHISRFYWEVYADPSKHAEPAYYQRGDKDFAILNFQSYGTEPMEPYDDFFRDDIYEERVFTFVMNTRSVYLGSQLIV